MQYPLIRKLLPLFALVLLSAAFAAAEQVETLGPQLIGGGAFLGNDGAQPPRPAGWVINSAGGADALWIEKGYRDKGRAQLLSTSSDGSLNMTQKRWASGADCYLLSFFWQGNGSDVNVSVSLKAEDGRVLCRSSNQLFKSGSWREERIFLDIFPQGLDGELITSFDANGQFNLNIDHVSLRAYQGPYTRIQTEYDDAMPFSPLPQASVVSPVLFTWPTVPWAEKYRLVLATEREE